MRLDPPVRAVDADRRAFDERQPLLHLHPLHALAVERMQRRVDRAVDHRDVIRPARARHRRVDVRPDAAQHLIDLDRIRRKDFADQIDARRAPCAAAATAKRANRRRCPSRARACAPSTPATARKRSRYCRFASASRSNGNPTVSLTHSEQIGMSAGWCFSAISIDHRLEFVEQRRPWPTSPTTRPAKRSAGSPRKNARRTCARRGTRHPTR